MKSISNQKGQSLVEYLIIVALVGVSAIGIMSSVGQSVKVQFAKVGKALGADVKGDPKATITQASYEKRNLRNFMQGSLNSGKSGSKDSGGDSSDGSSED